MIRRTSVQLLLAAFLAMVLFVTAFSQAGVQASSAPLPIVTGSWSKTANGVYTPFGTGAPPYIGETTNTVSEKMFFRFTATFPAGTFTNKQIIITLKDSLRWEDYGVASIPPAVFDSLSGPLNRDTVYGINMGNGHIIYKFKDTAMTVTLTIQVSQNLMDNYALQENAIQAVASFADSANEVISLPTQTDVAFSTFAGITVENAYTMDAATDKPTYAAFAIGRVHNYLYNAPTPHRTRGFSNFDIYVSAPDGALVTGVQSIGFSVTNTAVGGPNSWTYTSNPDPLNAGRTIWKFSKTNFGIYGYGVAPIWNFPSSVFNEGDQIETWVSKME